MPADEQNHASARSEEGNVSQDDPSHDKKTSETSHIYNNDIHDPNVVMQGAHATVIQHATFSFQDYGQIGQLVQHLNASSSKNAMSGGSLLDSMDQLKRAVVAAMQEERENLAAEDETRAKTTETSRELPLERSKIEAWYYQLDEHKQFLVQAVALLHGGKTREIDQLRDELYRPIREIREQRRLAVGQASQNSSQQESAMYVPDRQQASSKLYEGTFTEFRMVGHVERLYWQDADEKGNSNFGLRVLRFFAREAAGGGWGDSGPSFFAAAVRWSETLSGDCYWRGAYALGILWRCQDKEKLQQFAELWGNDKGQRNWRRAASLLMGAYEIEHMSFGDDVATKTYASQVLAIVNEWCMRAHTYKHLWVGCAAAHTYGLIGKKHPELAMQGLDRLLAFPLYEGFTKNAGIPVTIFATALSNYIALAWVGHLQLLLCHIATRADELSHRRAQQRTSIYALYRFQRVLGLDVVFNIFFLLAASSFPDKDGTVSGGYSVIEALPQPPTIPDPHGRDTILAGLLTRHTTGWREEVIVLLSAAIVENKSALTFHFLQQWAYCVIQLSQEEGQHTSREIYLSFKEFLIQLAERLYLWSQDLISAGFKNQQAIVTYKRNLNGWCQDALLKPMAQQVLDHITRNEEV